jgi:hypothetical protein
VTASTRPAVRTWRLALLGALALAGIVVAFSLEPIPQDPAYHGFADRRALLGVPNFGDVASNLPFALVGAFGLARVSLLRRRALRAEYLVYCAGTLLVAFGSAHYHLAPSTPRLVWDRLPMTVGFMALCALVVRDRVAERLGARLLWPLVAAGLASIAWWVATEEAGRGDLRPYAVVQFLPMLLLPVILLLFRGEGLDGGWLWRSFGVYLLAKVCEFLDRPILEATGLASGHTLKHLAAAGAALCIVRAALRPPLREPSGADRLRVATPATTAR